MENNLLTQALAKFFLGVIILGILIFLPAWSLHYWQGWLLMGILFVPMFVAGLVMLVKPKLVAEIPFMVLGVCLVVYGLSDCINSFVIHRKRKKALTTTLPMERGEYVDFEEVKE